MASDKYSNSDSVFTENTIEEIQRFIHKRRSEVERKKDELRSLVGERHRDIIDASDRILVMKNLTSEIFNDLDTLKSYACVWDHKFCSKEKSFTDKKYSLCTIAQIKLLLDVPELIWNSMDSGEHTSSTKYFFVGRYLNTRLQLSGETQLANIDARVLVKRSWNSLVHMEMAVISAYRRRLRAPPSSKEEICDSLIALLLLENLDLSEALVEFFNERQVALSILLGIGDVDSSAAIGTRLHQLLPVRKQMALVSRLLSSTMDTTRFLFCPNYSDQCRSPPTIISRLLSVLEFKLGSTLDSSFLSRDSLYVHLPDDVLDFKLKDLKILRDLAVLKQSTTITDEFFGLSLVDIMRRWNVWWKEAIISCHSSLSDSLTHISSLGTLLDVRTSILNLVTKWMEKQTLVSDTSIESFGELSSFNLWVDLFRDLFLNRLKVVLNQSLDRCLNELIEQVDKLILKKSEVVFQPCKEEKTNLASPIYSVLEQVDTSNQIDWAGFVWSDCRNDVPMGNLFKSAALTETNSTYCEFSSSLNKEYWNTDTLSQLVKSNDIGLIVFCCLTRAPIPVCKLSFKEKLIDSEHVPAHLLVFLQRLVAGTSLSMNMEPFNIQFKSHYGQNYLSHKLHVQHPELQFLCQKLDSDLSSHVVKLACDSGRDSREIWELIISAVKLLVSRFRNWLSLKAYGVEFDILESKLDQELIITPSCGLLLSRLCLTLINSCPSISASLIAATGVIESNFSGEATDTVRLDSSGSSYREEFMWSNFSILRSAWESVSQSLYRLANQIMLDSLLFLTTQNSVINEFRCSLKSAFSLNFTNVHQKIDQLECNDQLDVQAIRNILFKYENTDYWLQESVPFEKILLEPDTKYPTEDSDSNMVAVIKIPSGISLPLHQMLLNTVQKIVRSTIITPLYPPYSHRFFFKIYSTLLKEYSGVIDYLTTSRDMISSAEISKNSEDSNLFEWNSFQQALQLYAVQILFDLKFLHRLLTSFLSLTDVSSNKEQNHENTSGLLQTELQENISRVEALIDPFDLNVFSSRLNRNILQTIASVIHLYAPIMGPCSFSQIEALRASKFSFKEEKNDTKLVSFLPLIPSSRQKLNFTSIPFHASIWLNRWTVKQNSGTVSK